MDNKYQKDRWFVDVRGEMRGPTTSWKIIEDLLADRVKVIHRVSRDQMQWKAICNEPYFESAVQHMLETLTAEATKFSPEQEGQTNVDELSGFHNLGSLNEKISEQLQHAQVLQDINMTMNGLRKLKSDILAKRKMVIQAKATVKDELHPDDRNVYVADRPGMNWNWKKLTVVGGLLAVLLGGLQYYNYKDQQQAAEEARLAKEAMEAKLKGDYARVIQTMGQMENWSHLDATQLMDMAEIHVAEGQYRKGESLLQQAMVAVREGPEKARASNLHGVIAARQKDFQTAERFFTESMRENSEVYGAIHNMAVLKLSLNEPEQAEPFFLKAVALKGVEVGSSVLGLYETALQLDRRDHVANVGQPQIFKRLNQVKGVISQYRKQNPQTPFHEELLVIEVHMLDTLGNQSELKRRAETFVLSDPKATPKKELPLGIDYDRTRWDHIYNYCLEVYKKDQRSALMNAFFGACLLRTKGANEARPYVEYAANVDPENLNYKKLLTIL